jgi:hypothetical protein
MNNFISFSHICRLRRQTRNLKTSNTKFLKEMLHPTLCIVAFWHPGVAILMPNRAQSVFATVNCDSFVNLLPFNVLAYSACVMYRRLQLHGASHSLQHQPRMISRWVKCKFCLQLAKSSHAEGSPSAVCCAPRPLAQCQSCCEKHVPRDKVMLHF